MHQPLDQSSRKIGLTGAISTNILYMVGVGPFLTIPLALAAMGGPQVIVGWLIGAFIAVCDGMVWAELGSAMPMEGGPYQYLLRAFGPKSYGLLFSFLFLVQSVILGPISIAAGAVGFAQYSGYLTHGVGPGRIIAIAAAVCLLNTLLVYRDIQSIAYISLAATAVVFVAMIWIVVSGVAHLDRALAFDFPPHAFQLSRGFFAGLGSAALIALYDYGGYYNVCLIGSEVREPRKTIPVAIMVSILVVAAFYLAMNFAIIGVVPWRQAIHSNAIVSDFMDRIYGPVGARAVTVLILVATFGSVFAVLLGYSRVLHAAAVEGRFLSVFARLHPTGKFPHVSVLAVGIASAMACALDLESLIKSMVVTQILLQAIGLCVAVMLLRKQKAAPGGSYRMPLYPLPALLALAGWNYIFFTSGARYIALGCLLLACGTAVYLVLARRRAEWPFQGGAA